MKSLRLRMAVWFGVCFMALAAAFMFFSHRLLEDELLKKTWQKDYPEHPDWKLHGSFSEAEVRDITKELMEAALIGTAPLVVIAALLGWWLARRSLVPISNVNRQLQAKTPANLGEPIQLPEMDAEFRGLLSHLNDLLSRLDASFSEMNDYAAKVAHELRTPLAIMRLKVEQADGRIHPDLAEELEGELHRLTHVVDQSLLIARAEQGRSGAQRATCDLTALVTEVVEDFELLAREENRHLSLTTANHLSVTADERHLRQILHNLLTNALKHGQGDLRVRVKAAGARVCLIIFNRMEIHSPDSEKTLGLGLRVVSTLLRLDPQVRFQRRWGLKYHVVRLSFPVASCLEARGPAGGAGAILPNC